MVMGSMLKPRDLGLGSLLKPPGVDFFGLELFMRAPIFLFQHKVKGAFLKPLFFMVLGTGLFLCVLGLSCFPF